MLEATRKEAAAKREAAEARREAQQLAEELARKADSALLIIGNSIDTTNKK